MWLSLAVNAALSLLGYYAAANIIPKFRDMFLKANISGKDLNKANHPQMYASFALNVRQTLPEEVTYLSF